MWRLNRLRATRLLATPAYGIINPRIYHNHEAFRNDQRINFYPVVGLRGIRSATLIMNKPNYNNMLSAECMGEMYRFYRSFELDESVNHIWVENKGVNCFGGGVEFDELVKDDDYLRKLFLLSSMIAKLNKPVLGHIKGSVRGASAYLLRMLSMPFGARNANLQLNDINRGWVPTCGGSYQLTRMTGDMGTYLALTGASIDSNEMCELGFLNALLREGKKSWQYQSLAAKHAKFGGHSHYVDEMDVEDTPNWRLIRTEIVQEEYENRLKHQQMHLLRNHEKEHLALHLTKTLRKQRQIGLANIQSPQLVNGNPQTIINYFHLKESMGRQGLEDSGLIYPSNSEIFRRLPLSKINKHFHHNTVEEIFQSLKNDSSKWAQETLATLQEKDPLALKLTLRLIREAKNSDFASCLERQYLVASKLRVSDHFLGVYKNGRGSAQLADISKEQVDSYFQGDLGEKLDHGMKKYALYPVKDYRDVLPDAVRFFLNRHYWEDHNRDDNQFEEVQRWLRAENIAHELVTFDPDVIREKVWMRFALRRKTQAELEAITDILHDQKLEKEYREERRDYVEKIFSNEPEAKKMLDSEIALLFRKRIKERSDELDDTAKCFGKQQKSKLFQELRTILTEKRLTQTNGQPNKEVQHYGLVYFPKDDRQGTLETFNHHLADTPFGVLKRRIDSGSVSEPFTALEEAEMNTFIHNDRETQYTLQNYHYREYKLRYNEQYPKIYNNIFARIIEQAQAYSTNMNEALEKLSPEELEQSLMAETFKGVTYADLIKKFIKTLQDDPTGLEVTPQQIDWHTLLKSEEPPFENGNPWLGIFDVDPIPEALKSKFAPLLQRIYQGVCKTYGKWDELSKLSQGSELDRQLFSLAVRDWNEFIKNDVKFLFSYFAIREVESLLKTLQSKRGFLQGSQLIDSLKAQSGLDFSTEEEVASTFNDFMYALIEMYDQSRQKLLFLSSKHIERMNRLTSAVLTEKSQPNLQTFLFSLAKNQSVLLDRLKGQPNPLQGDAPQALDNLGKSENVSRLSQHLRTQMERSTKRLIAGSTHYLRELSRIYMLTMGRDTFLPVELAIDEQLAQIPQFFSALDQRKPVQLWFSQKLEETLRSIFDFRLEQQKKMTKQELRAFDRDFAELLKPQNFKHLMMDQIEAQMMLLESIRAGRIESQKPREPEPKTFMSFVKNREALHRLNTLLMTARLQELCTEDENTLDDYEQTIERLLSDTFSEKKEPKKLDENQLQRENFQYIASPKEKFDRRDSQLEKGQGLRQDIPPEQMTLVRELKAICRMHSQDELFKQLSGQL